MSHECKHEVWCMDCADWCCPCGEGRKCVDRLSFKEA